MICFLLELIKIGQAKYTNALYDLKALVFCVETNGTEEVGCWRTAVQRRDSNRRTCFIERERNIVDVESNKSR